MSGKPVAGAEALHRAESAARLARCAPRRAEIHERLVEVVAPPARDERGGQVPENALSAHAGEPARTEEHAAQNAPHVGVEYRRVAAVREGQDRAGRVAADAGHAAQLLLTIGQAPAVARDALARDRVQPDRPD